MKIELKNVCVSFESGTELEKRALSDIDLNFDTSESVLLVGNTGSGKTTLIYLLDLLIKPSYGTLLYDGENPFNDAYNFRKKFGVAFQIPERQFFNETVEQEITYAARNFEIDYTYRDVLNILNLFELDESILKKSPFKLSGGEQRKIAIASILFHKPEFLIFDEPTAGLDLSGILSIRKTLMNFRDENKGFLIATHEPEIFYDVCDRIVTLVNGQLVENRSLVEYQNRGDVD